MKETDLIKLIESFDALNERKRKDTGSLDADEKIRWRQKRCQIEQLMFGHPCDPETDTRDFLRVPIALQLRYPRGEQIEEKYLTVLGEGGLFIATTEPLPKDSELELEIIPIGKGKFLKLLGQVTWQKLQGPVDSLGMGIRFVGLEEEQKQHIYALVDDALRQALLEKRRFPRIDTRLGLAIEHEGELLQVVTQDLSMGGMFIVSDRPVAVGDEVEFELRLPGDMPKVRGKAEVVRTIDNARPGQSEGFGVQFVDLNLNLQQYICDRVSGKVQPSGDEPRKQARLKRRIKTRFFAVNSYSSPDARDLSTGGVFVQTPEPAPPTGSPIEVTMVHPLTLQTINLKGNVVRAVPAESEAKPTGPAPGVGIEFDDSDEKIEELQSFLRDFVFLEKLDLSTPLEED